MSLSSSNNENFFTTRWTQVAHAKGDSDLAKRALSELCEAYYAPVQAFIRATVKDDEASRDLTQAFFAQVLKNASLNTADPSKGRFRSFLLGAVKHFLSDHWRHSRRLKRGGGQPDLSIDTDTPTSPGIQPPDAQLPPDAEFDRRWALAILAKALAKLREAWSKKEQLKTFDTLKPWLTGDHADLRQADAAQQLGINENAVKVAIHRLRKQFREAVKQEIAHTLTNPEQVAEELKHLEAALRGR